jgi:hypothetical protein
LFEGDTGPAPAVSGPGTRFVTGVPSAPVSPLGNDLPGSYATGRVWATVADPQRLLVQWGFSARELHAAAAQAADGHLLLSVRSTTTSPGGGVLVVLPAGATSWFVPVSGGGTFVAELGWYDASRCWRSLAVSEPVTLSAEKPAPAENAEFATIPVDVPFAEIFAKVKEAAEVSAPLIEIITHLREAGFTGLPEVGGAVPPQWTPEQERALAEVLHVEPNRRVWVGSLDVTELVRDLAEVGPVAPSSAALAAGAEAARAEGLAGPAAGVSSLEVGGERPGRRGFWFNVNAELIVYGATEPDAKLTIAGRPVKLRPDGSFALRFALPDGEYELPVQAVAADGVESRRARLEFRRATEYHGATAHPQDSGLRPPTAEHVNRSVIA